MPINFSCSCGKKLLVADTLAGKKVKCPGCQAILVVPQTATKAAPTAPPPAKSAKAIQAPPNKPAPPASAPKNGPAPPRKSAPIARPPADDFDDEPEERPAKRRSAQRSAPEAKSKRGLLIAALLGLLLVVGGGAAGWWFFLSEPAQQPRPNPGPIAQGTKPADPEKPGTEELPPANKDPEPENGSTAKSKPGEPLEIRRLPAGADGFVSVRFADWWASKSADVLRKTPPAKEMQAALDEIGISAADIERIQASFFIETNRKDKFAPPVSLFAAVLAKKPMDIDRIKSKFPRGTRENVVGGKYYYRFHTGPDLLFHFRNDRLLVAASDPIMKKYLTGELKFDSKGFDLEPTKTKHLVAEGKSGLLEEAPLPKFAELRYLADLKSFRVIAHSEDALDLDVRLTFSNDAKAGEVTAAAKKYLVLGEQFLKKASTDLPETGDPLAKKLVQFAADALAKLKVGSDADTLTAQASLAVADLGTLVEGVDKASARAVQINNFKQIGIGFFSFRDTNGGRYPTAKFRGGLSWRVALLPYMQEIPLYHKFNLDEPWDSPHNIKLLPLMPKIYMPLGDKKAEPGHTYLQVFTGPNTPFAEDKKALTREGLTDDASSTFLVVEGSKAVPWTKPDDVAIDPQAPLPKLGGGWPGGFFACMFDWSCHFVPYSVDEKTLRQFIDPADGSKPSIDAFYPPGTLRPEPKFKEPPQPYPGTKGKGPPEPFEKKGSGDKPAPPLDKGSRDKNVPPPPKKPAADLAIEWVRNWNVFGLDHKIVADVTRQFERDVGPNKGFILRLGKNLVATGKQTLVCGWGGELFVFQLNAEQAERSPFNPGTMVLRTIEQGSRGRAELALTGLKIDDADKLDPAMPITGTLGVQLLGGEKGLEGRFAVRCVYSGGGQRVALYKPYPSEFLIPDGKPMAFKFDSLAESKVKHTGVLVLFIDVVRNPGGPGETAISRPRAVLVNVAAAKQD